MLLIEDGKVNFKIHGYNFGQQASKVYLPLFCKYENKRICEPSHKETHPGNLKNFLKIDYKS